MVYSSPVPDLESLRNRIVACSEDIRNTPGFWDRVRRSMRHRCEVCIQAGGGLLNIFCNNNDLRKEKRSVQRHTRIRLYKTLVRPVLRYGSEAWILRKKDESRITANEMKFMRYTAGYTKWDHKRNEDVMEELQLEPVINHVKHYQNNWINHLHRMHRDRIPKVMLHYRPNGRDLSVVQRSAGLKIQL
ncbi:hypothetical protein ANN_23211 [Periplaneta americana]|uniref:Uncharacterized protein n=1 Tax=Periplaneta americana TaxID=6978 RepID=A0ABQ8SLY4_PERAM|nr:hypothetical protein ANN_23211 [Periplaneta americana]